MLKHSATRGAETPVVDGCVECHTAGSGIPGHPGPLAALRESMPLDDDEVVKMFSARKKLGAAAVLGIGLTVLAVPAPATAADPIVLPAGLACDFGVSLQATTEPKTVTREWVDGHGNSVTLVAGKGSTYVVTNTDTGASVTLSGKGFTQTTTAYADGSSRTLDTGHNLVILFPTDNPAGPSTTLYIGVVELTNSADGVTTLEWSAGRSRDICAELS